MYTAHTSGTDHFILSLFRQWIWNLLSTKVKVGLEKFAHVEMLLSARCWLRPPETTLFLYEQNNRLSRKPRPCSFLAACCKQSALSCTILLLSHFFFIIIFLRGSTLIQTAFGSFPTGQNQRGCTPADKLRSLHRHHCMSPDVMTLRSR